MDEDAWPVIDLARAAGWPLLAEPVSGLRRPGAALAAGQALMGAEPFVTAHRPDVVVQVGATPTTRAALAFGERAGRLIVIEQDGAPATAGRSAWKTIQSDPSALARSLLGEVEPRGETAWLRAWRRADARARATLDAVLDSFDEPFEGRVARDLADALPGDSILFAGSSMPIRDLDFFMAPREGLRVLGNRGASGIDGIVSTVLGIASSGVLAVGLIGDLSLLHDVGALVWNARQRIDATLVVIDNDGGGIFDVLPHEGLPEHERLFVTPHGLALGAILEAAEARHTRVSHAPEAIGAVLDRRPGLHVVTVPIARARALEQRTAVRDAISSTLNGLAPSFV
jgi:2-succinyl-5-enolpyruvyl-6-hydroxy-3-cyclohexene-1-carboxylate synthase